MTIFYLYLLKKNQKCFFFIIKVKNHIKLIKYENKLRIKKKRFINIYDFDMPPLDKTYKIYSNDNNDIDNNEIYIK